MKIITSFLLLFFCTTGAAQTNPTNVPPEPPALQPTRFQPATESEPPAESIADASNRVRLRLDLPLPKQDSHLLDDFPTQSLEETPAATAVDSDQALMLQYSARLNAAGYMNPTPPPPEDLFSRTVIAMFQPEPLQVARVSVAFSPITAIKRKNPLALLNPLVLNISW